MNLDVSPKFLSETEAFFLLNHERYLGKKGDKNGVLGKTTPAVANYPACEMEMPAGENYSTGDYFCNLTNELYSWVHNSNEVHFIERVKGDGTCEVVYHHPCLKISADPKHAIEKWRAYMRVDKPCAGRDGKYLVWVDGTDFIGFLDTEAAIATNNFTTPFFDICPDPCAMVSLCVPDPCECLKGEFQPLSEGEAGKTNHTTDIGLKLSYRHVYYDGIRSSIWADPTTLLYQNVKGCFDNSAGLPRCIKLFVPIGNPMVEKIEIAVQKNGIWQRTAVIEKYKKYNNSQQKWYERELSEAVADTFNEADCTFEYLFCDEGQCDAIDLKEFNRVFNPMPRSPQGILNIEDALGFYNYEQGNCPIDRFEVEKMKINLTCDDNNCEQEFVTIKVRAIIHNRYHGGNQFIYRLGGDNNSPDDDSDTAYFGGLNNTGIGTGDLESGYDQYFRDKTRNFIAYVEGTEYYATMKQWKSHAFFNNLEDWGTLANLDDKSRLRRWRRAINNGEFFYQEAEIKVPKGTKGFLRLTSHESTGNDQDKSTFVYGIMDDIHQYKGRIDVSTITDETIEEIYFDTCSLTGDKLDIDKAFVIDDNAVDTGLASKASSYYGYITDNSGRPVEGALITLAGATTSKTDHNGFYHLYLFPGSDDQKILAVEVERDCFSFNSIETIAVEGEKGAATRQDYKITDENYDENIYTNVIMQVKNCEGYPVGGIRVALSGTKYKVTGADGFARFKIRNYSTRDRVVRGIVLNNKGCLEINCAGECFPCMPTSTATTAPCYTGGTQTTTLGVGIINIDSITNDKNGLKAGGEYPIGFVVKGDCGRQSAVNKLPNISIPKTQSKTKEGFCGFGYNATGMKLPLWGKCLQIVRGVNLNPFELQWVVDEIERTDDGKIKLTIQSLNDYNERFLFKTNTIYQWIKGDRVEFIKNGDGKIFSISQNGLLNYLTISPFNDELISGQEEAPADFFNQLLIEDDGKLDSLKKGAIIELQREKNCTVEPTYFGICATIPIVDGELLYPVGTFHTFDTYFVNRKIGELPTQRFEHHSPSDFWGQRLDDTGKPYFENEYENEQRYGRNITINSPNDYARFGDLVRTLNPVTHGDLIAMFINDGKIGLAISEHDNSLFEIGDDLLRVGGDGIVRAAGPDALISDTQPKLSGKYGCQYPHIGSIAFGDGWVTWWDVNAGHYVKHDYQLAKPFDEGKAHNYFRKRGQEIEFFNRTATNDLDKFRFTNGYNQLTGALYITTKSLRHNGINNESGVYKKPNDTIGIHPVAEDVLGFFSFTPDRYGNVNIFDGNGCAFVSYLNGVPYIHPVIPIKWNEFYGIAVDWMIGVAINKFPEKIKIGIGLEEQSEKMFFVEEVTTDQEGYRSEIPPRKPKKSERKWNASFLGNINSRAGLYGGELPRGYYICVLLKRDNTDELKYLTINNDKRVEYSELDSFIFKFAISEQSGMTENL